MVPLTGSGGDRQRAAAVSVNVRVAGGAMVEEALSATGMEEDEDDDDDEEEVEGKEDDDMTGLRRLGELTALMLLSPLFLLSLE